MRRTKPPTNISSTRARPRFSWTANQLLKLERATAILDELKEWKPITLRQLFYQFVSKGFIENTQSKYASLSYFLKWARIKGKIPWEDIEDRSRSFFDLTGWDSSEAFVDQSMRWFLKGYKRDLLQSQNKFIELWIEKDALSSIFERVAEPYTISVVVARGFSSASFLNDFQKRIAVHADKNPVMLYFGDFDPSGMEMMEAMKTTLGDEMMVKGIKLKRIALSEEDIFKYRLPHDPRALKKNDPRAKRHEEIYGELAVELDALPPAILISKIREAIEAELDMGAFNDELEEQETEFNKLNELQAKVKKFIEGI